MTLESGLRGGGTRQLVAADISVAQALGQQSRKVLGTAVRFARESDHCHGAATTPAARLMPAGVYPIEARLSTGGYMDFRRNLLSLSRLCTGVSSKAATRDGGA